MNHQILNWFQEKGYACFKLSYSDGRKIHSEEEENSTFDNSFESLKRQLSMLDTGKYNLIVFEKKGSIAGKSERDFSISISNFQQQQAPQNSGIDAMQYYQMGLTAGYRQAEEMNALKLQMQEMKLALEGGGNLTKNAKEIIPLLPSIMQAWEAMKKKT